MSIEDWDNYFMPMLSGIAKKSKDPHTKFGCLIVDPENGIKVTGYNSFPRGINDNVPERLERPLKYTFIEHAERNALYQAARTGIALNGCRIYMMWYPCSPCARGLIQCGIAEIIINDRDDNPWKTKESLSRWSEDMKYAMEMLSEAGVEIRKWR